MTSPPWKDLPHELAGMLLSRLASHDDRLSFANVCHDWRLAAKDQRPLLPPAVPCINLGKGEYQSIIDGKVRRFPMPSDCRADASFGNLLLYWHGQSFICFLQDPFCGTTPAIEIPCSYNWMPLRANDVVCHLKPHTVRGAPHSYIQKIVLFSPKLVMALFQGCPFFNYANFGGCCPGTPPPDFWSEAADIFVGEHHRGIFCYDDVAFHHGKIFALYGMGNLFTHEFVGDSLSESRVEHVIKEQPNTVYMDMKCYLVTSADKKKLLMVMWSILEVMNELKLDHHTIDLRVFEAHLDKGRWSEVKDLGDQVLFVGPTGSRAFAVTGSSKHYHKNFRGNLVFLSGYDWTSKWERKQLFAKCKCFNCQKFVHGVPNYCVFDIMSGKSSIVSLSRSDTQRKYFRSEWFFPSA
ncbi:hypothetical protein D1007_08276 [Hordeum vulgare]|nr:hypothetical protein D1007_08276 [Hordeum vulgare]